MNKKTSKLIEVFRCAIKVDVFTLLKIVCVLRLNTA